MAFTYFFRDSHTLELTVKHMAPEVMGRSRIRIWDAGCAMGPEPYTLAILCAENLGKFAFKNLSIQATEQTQKLPPEMAPYLKQVVGDAQLFRKVNGGP